MSRTIQLHPFSVAVGAITVACAGLLAGGGGAAGPPSPLDFMSVLQIDDGFGNMIDTVRFSGCNVQVVNGLDDTETINGSGNLIVGYNEFNPSPFVVNDRTGSHNIVGGRTNNYSSHGGLVVGQDNAVSDEYASISGGLGNEASGADSSVSGGQANTASGVRSSVSGGRSNEASGFSSSVSGGGLGTASGIESSVSGGFINEVSGGWASVGGGCGQTAMENCQHLPCNQCPTDTNADGVVDVDDLVAIIVTWGTVCP